MQGYQAIGAIFVSAAQRLCERQICGFAGIHAFSLRETEK